MDSFRKIRKQIRTIKSSEVNADSAIASKITHNHHVQLASSRLHEAISSLWRCERPEVHFANISLDLSKDEIPQDKQHVRFDMAWTCPAQYQSQGQMMRPIRLLIDALSESSAAINHQAEADMQQRLEVALDMSVRPSSSSSRPNQPSGGRGLRVDSETTRSNNTIPT